MTDILIVIQLLAVAGVMGYIAWDHRSSARFRERVKVQHDAVCEGGAWPHPFTCMPKGDTADRELVSWLVLSRTSALGVGILPVALMVRMDLATTVQAREEDRTCEGAES